ncbi:MAG: AAA family ATPase [Rhodocyclaceae bacterium]
MKSIRLDSGSVAAERATVTSPQPFEGQTAEVVMMKLAALSRNPETLEALRDYAGGEGAAIQLQIWPGQVAHLGAMIEQEHPDILLLEAQGASGNELDVLERVVAGHPALSVILVCVQQSPEFLLRALHIGVRDVIQLPVTRKALQEVIGKIRERRQQGKTPRQRGKVLALLPCKGGAGATFLAANLACALAAEGKRTCLIDLNFHFGEASLYVSEARPTSTVTELLQQIQRLDGPLLESSMLRVAPNFWLLAAPDSPEKAVDIRPESIERLLSVARGHYDFVLLDVSRTLDANAIRALDHADDIFLVLQMTLPFLRDAARLLRLFRSLDYPEGRVHVLVNRFEKGGDISLNDLERGLGVAAAFTVPNSFGPVAVSINQGRPIIELAPDDPVSGALRKMARELALVPEAEESWLRRLLKRKA